MTGDPVRVAMWSGPRNISTAMMRAFGNRPDTVVIDEPFYAAYLDRTGIDHPMRDEVLASQNRDWSAVAEVLAGAVPGGARVWYQKHMCQHMLPGFGTGWMASCRNAFLIRRPDAVVASYGRKREQPTLADIGVVRQAELFDAVAQRLGHAPPVIDSADVAAAPRATLQRLCAALGLDFTDAMLSWPAGPRDSDGVWGPVWYDQVENSTGFSARPAAAPVLDAPLRAVADAAWPFYQRLAVHRL